MKISALKKIVLTLAFVFIVAFSFAQTGPGDPGSGPSGNDPPAGGNAPVGGGLAILITLGAIYGSKSLFRLFDTNTNTDNV